jgi:hypothetical protein
MNFADLCLATFDELTKIGMPTDVNCDVLTAYRKGLEDGQAKKGWLPIETAPRDGTKILLAGSWLSGTWDIDVGHYLVTRFNFCGETQPTHWMPLPEPPIS